MIAILSVLIALAGAEQAVDGAGVVRESGTASGIGRSARAAAIEDGQRRVLADYLIELTGSSDLTVFGPMLDEPGGYFSSCRLLEEDRTSGVSTAVELAMEVDKGRVDGAAARLLARRLSYVPRVLFLASKRVGDDKKRCLLERYEPACEAITRALKSAGLVVVSADEARKQCEETELLGAFAGPPILGSGLGRECLVDLVVLADLVAEQPEEEDNGVFTEHRAKTVCRVIRAGDAALVGELKTEALVHSVDPDTGGEQAILDAAEKLGQPLVVATVLGAIHRRKAQDVLLTIEGPEAPARFAACRSVLRDKLGVEGIDELETSGNAIRVRLDFGGSMRDLVRALTRTEFDEFYLKAPRVVNRNVTFSLVAIDPDRRGAGFLPETENTPDG